MRLARPHAEGDACHEPTMLTSAAGWWVVVGSMSGCWRQLLKHARIHRRVVGDDLDWGNPEYADPPLGTDRVPARACGVSQRRDEPLHPPVDGDVVGLHASVGEQLFDVAIGQAEAEA